MWTKTFFPVRFSLTKCFPPFVKTQPFGRPNLKHVPSGDSPADRPHFFIFKHYAMTLNVLPFLPHILYIPKPEPPPLTLCLLAHIDPGLLCWSYISPFSLGRLLVVYTLSPGPFPVPSQGAICEAADIFYSTPVLVWFTRKVTILLLDGMFPPSSISVCSSTAEDLMNPKDFTFQLRPILWSPNDFRFCGRVTYPHSQPKSCYPQPFFRLIRIVTARDSPF